jgi:hypothetical protein
MCCSFQYCASARATVGLVRLSRLLELAECGLDHRPQVREVAGGGADLCGDHDLLLVDDRLRVVALDVAAVALHRRESGSVTFTSPGGIAGGV